MATDEKLPPIGRSLVLSNPNQQLVAHPTAYKVSGSKHFLPPKERLNPGQDTCTGTIETWPAHASKSVSNTSILFRGKAPKNRTPKPKFLSGLEAYAKRELYILKCEGDEPSELRLQAFREVFEYLIDDFKTYKPLLSQIKNEYEKNLSSLRQQIRELEPLKSMLVTVSEKCEQKIQAIREAEQHEIKELLQNRMELLDVIDRHRENEVSLNTQIARLQEELASEYKRYRNEHEMRKMLLSEINELRSQNADQKKATNTEAAATAEEEDPDSDPVMLKIALKCARNDLTRCLDELNVMKADYNDVVPRRDYGMLLKKHEGVEAEAKGLRQEFSKLHMEHKTLLQVHDEVLVNRDEIYTEVTKLKRSATPRPSWANCHESLAVDEDKWRSSIKDKSSKDILAMLLQEVAAGGGGGGGNNFTGKGTADDVPKYLRYEGPVKNRNMSKTELSNLMKEIWAAKAKSDGERGSKQAISEFLYDFFMEKFHGVPEFVAEWAYSMQESLEKYKDEDNVLFLQAVLEGTANEEFYYHHMDVIRNLMLTLQASDPDSTGTISVYGFSEALATAYPRKKPSQSKELLKACLQELGETESTKALLKYMDVFTEDEEGHTGPFLNLLRRQENEEINAYVKDVTDQVKSNKTNEVGMMLLREAFMMVDPGINEEQMLKRLCLAFRCSPEELDDVEPIPLETLLKKLPKSGVHRC